jgi:hypothetical protein
VVAAGGSRSGDHGGDGDEGRGLLILTVKVREHSLKLTNLEVL